MGKGYAGKIMNVNLTTGTIEYETIPDDLYKQVLSGVGLAAKLLYDRIPADADPLGPDNILAFTSGMLTGSGAFFSGRWMVCGKSPLTGGWGDANCGGTLAPAIKRCGVDAIFFSGISKKPVYLKVVDGKAELVDAAPHWGLDAIEAEKSIAAEVGAPNVRVATIGPSGEKLSLISGVVNDGGRIAARSGLGAVMGSKRLKGIALADKKKIEIDDKNKIRDLNKQFMKWFKRGLGVQKVFGRTVLDKFATVLRVSPVALALNGDLIKIAFSKYGTISTNVLSSESGDSPVKNWKGSGAADFPLGTKSYKINPEFIIAHETKKYHCFACPLGCGGILEVPQKDGSVMEMHKVEYETACAFGTLLLNDDLDAIFTANDLLNRAGMDTISAGATVAFAIECMEQGILTKQDMDGLELTWGATDAVIEFIKKMIAREGCGDLFADGSKKASEKIGKGCEKFAMHAGGQEMAMHDSRYDPGFGVSYCCEPTPGRHTNHGYQWAELFSLNKIFKNTPKMPHIYRTKERYAYTRDKAKILATASKFMQLVNGSGVCLFGVQLSAKLPFIEYLNATTGWKLSPEEYLEIGGRIQALRQSFNIKHGVRPKTDFALPKRAQGMPPLEAGPLKNVTLPMDKISGDFYEEMGWDPENAYPLSQTLEALGLDSVSKDLYGKGK